MRLMINDTMSTSTTDEGVIAMLHGSDAVKLHAFVETDPWSSTSMSTQYIYDIYWDGCQRYRISVEDDSPFRTIFDAFVAKTDASTPEQRMAELRDTNEGLERWANRVNRDYVNLSNHLESAVEQIDIAIDRPSYEGPHGRIRALSDEITRLRERKTHDIEGDMVVDTIDDVVKQNGILIFSQGQTPTTLDKLRAIDSKLHHLKQANRILDDAVNDEQRRVIDVELDVHDAKEAMQKITKATETTVSWDGGVDFGGWADAIIRKHRQTKDDARMWEESYTRLRSHANEIEGRIRTLRDVVNDIESINTWTGTFDRLISRVKTIVQENENLRRATHSGDEALDTLGTIADIIVPAMKTLHVGREEHVNEIAKMQVYDYEFGLTEREVY